MDVIERTLARFGAYVQVLPPPHSYETSRARVYLLNRAEKVKIEDVLNLDDELDDEIARLRGAQTPTRFLRKPLAVVIPKVQPQWIPIRTLLQSVTQRDGLVLTLGEHYDHSANPQYSGPRSPSWLRVDLSSPETPHVLIAGTTGSGKTGVMKCAALSLAVSASPETTAFIFIDIKAVEGLPGLGGLPHLAHEVVTEAKEVVPVLAAVVAEMFNRSAAAKADPHRRFNWKRIVVFIDELLETLGKCGPDAQKHIETIATLGRGVGIHLVAGTQTPRKNEIGPAIMNNLRARVCGTVAVKEEGYYITGMPGTQLGAHKLSGRGDCILTIGGERMWNFQSAYIDLSDEARIVQSVGRWWKGRRSDLRLAVGEPAPAAGRAEDEGRLAGARQAVVQPPQPQPAGGLSKEAQRARHAEMMLAIRDEQARLGEWPSATRVAKIYKELYGSGLNPETAAKLLARAKGEAA